MIYDALNRYVSYEDAATVPAASTEETVRVETTESMEEETHVETTEPTEGPHAETTASSADTTGKTIVCSPA